MNYRREIDGLRALAVIPVIFFHAGFELFSGGFVGVDIFFVISGYLITSIIIAEIKSGTFSLINFYDRRVRRILPALFFIMAVCIPFAWLWLTPSDMKDFSQSLVAVPLFGSNILFWYESGYFDTAAELKPLLHTWSLAVEEQYYVLFPLFLITIWRLGKRSIIGLLIVFLVISLSIAHWGAFHKPAATFFLLPTRGWELLIGSLIAFYFFERKEIFLNKTASQCFSFLGLICILYSFVAFSKNTPFPSLFALVPTIGTALIILFATPKTLVGKILGSNIFVGIGLISYSAYLWHQPLFVFARHRSLTEPSVLLLISLSLITIPIAYFSWKYIEQPFRHKGWIGRKKIFLLAGIISLSFAAFGLAGQLSNGFYNRFPAQWFDNKPESKFSGIVKNGKNCSGREPEMACQIQSGENPVSFVIAGDSHARVLTQPAEMYLSKYNLKLIDLSSSGCPFFIDLNIYINGIEQAKCNAAYQLKRLTFLSTVEPSIVILHSRFSLYIHGDGFDNSIGGVEKIEPSYASKTSATSAVVRHSEIRESLNKTIEKLQSYGHKVVIIGPVPTNGWDPISRLYQLQRSGLVKTHKKRLGLMSIPYKAVSDRHKIFDSMMNEIMITNKNVIFVDPKEILCRKKFCSSITENSVLYSDTDHLSINGSKILFEYIIEKIQLSEAK